LNGQIVDPAFTGPCPTIPSASQTALRSWMTSNGITANEWSVQGTGWPPFQMDAFAHNIGWNRQSCIQNIVADLKADGRTFSMFGYDEFPFGYSTPVISGAIGGSDFTNVVFSGGTATFTTNI